MSVGLLRLLDDVGDGERLAGAGDAEQNLVLARSARARASSCSIACGLVPLGLELGRELEESGHGLLSSAGKGSGARPPDMPRSAERHRRRCVTAGHRSSLQRVRALPTKRSENDHEDAGDEEEEQSRPHQYDAARRIAVLGRDREGDAKAQEGQPTHPEDRSHERGGWCPSAGACAPSRRGRTRAGDRASSRT